MLLEDVIQANVIVRETGLKLDDGELGGHGNDFSFCSVT